MSENALLRTHALKLLDTLAAFLERKYPERDQSDRVSVGELADELLMFGYTTLAEVEAMLDANAGLFGERELESPPNSEPGAKFPDVGVVRITLGAINPDYSSVILSKQRCASSGADHRSRGHRLDVGVGERLGLERGARAGGRCRARGGVRRA